MKLTGSDAQLGKGKFRASNKYIRENLLSNTYFIPRERHVRTVSLLPSAANALGTQQCINSITVGGYPLVPGGSTSTFPYIQDNPQYITNGTKASI
jgi:UDP-3-O-acyl-N-acetylglucosamine deacetylase